jgi:tripartite-type tricarboxylate transporter receptor subunit TctC
LHRADLCGRDREQQRMRAILSQPAGAHCRAVCRRRHHDILARGLAQRLAERWGQQVVVENKPGGTGGIGAEAVAKAAPDGYTLLITADATFVSNPHLHFTGAGFKPAPTDPLQEFAPITGLGISPQALTVNPRLPVRTLSELIALARKQPGEITYGTFGAGWSGHLNIILLERMAGTRFTAVHYRGASPAITDVIGGHIGMVIVSIGLVAQPWQSGQLRVLGFGSTTRLAQYPDVPTLAESGLPGYEAGSWYGLAAPKGTPPEIIAALNAETRRIFEDPGFRDTVLAPNFIFSIVSSPEVFAERIRSEWAKWGEVIRDAGLKAE